MVCTLHIFAFYQKIIKRHILIENVNLNFNSFCGWCCWYHRLLGFDTLSFCKLYRPFTKEFCLQCRGWGNLVQERPVSTNTTTGCHQNSEGCAIFKNTVNRVYWNNFGALAYRRASGGWQRQGILMCSTPDSFHTTGSLNKGRCSTLFITGIEHRPLDLNLINFMAVLLNFKSPGKWRSLFGRVVSEVLKLSPKDTESHSSKPYS